MRIAPILIPHLKAPSPELWADAALAAMITHNDAGSTAACVAFAAADWARADSSLTHPHQVCQDSCAVFVAAIATAIATDCTAEACYQAALHEARRSSVAQPVVDALREAAERPPEDYQTHQGWVLIALQNAFYQLLHAPTLEEGVVHTVMAGGDTDTNAAIAGALLGAVHGRDAVPPQWLRSALSCRPLPKSGTSHPRAVEFWPVDALRLAEKLLVSGGAGLAQS